MVPEGWDTAPLSSLLERIIDYRGQSVPKANTGIPLITARNVRKGFLDFSSSEYVDEKSFDNWMTRGIPKAGDILFTTEAPLGNACRFPKDSVYAVGQRTVTLRCNDLLDSEFLLYSILSEKGQRLIDIRSSGSTAKGIKSSELKKVKLTYPIFLPEQRKIAKILQTWDRAIATTEKLIDASKQQKKALMQQLLTGKKRFTGFEGEWLSGSLVDFAGNIYGGGTPSRSESKYWGGSIPWVTVKDLTSTHITGAQEHITEIGLAESSSKIVQAGTPILATRMAVGKVVVANCDVAINQDLKAICNDKMIDSKYLFYLLLGISEKIENMGTGSTVKGVQIEAIKSLAMCIPSSLNEQKRATACLESADRDIAINQRKLTHLKQEKKALMQQLLTGKRRVKLDA